MAETKRERLINLHTSRKKELDSNWVPAYRDLSDFILPRRTRFILRNVNKGDRRNLKIIDSSATMASRTQRAGMFTGITSPARPWFRLQTPDPDLMEFHAVKNWLHIVEERMRNVMLRSNLYNALPIIYGDMGTFATGCMTVLEDAKNVFRCYPHLIGSYTLSMDENLRVDGMTREYTMTVRQLVNKFGNNVSKTTMGLYNQGKYDEMVDVIHTITSNMWREYGRIDNKNMPITSCYMEKAADSLDAFLLESGFNDFPTLAPRWEVSGEDTYGTESPGWVCIGDVKALQTLHKQKAKANQKTIDPPMTAPSSMRNQKATLISGDITYVDVAAGQQGFQPAHEVRMDIRPVLQDIEEHQQRISRSYYEDLFLMLAQSNRREITAREIEERHEEKLLMLGPVLERLNAELLDPLIDRVFGIMMRNGLLPEPPEELQGMDLRVEYISIMAQAQKILGLNQIDRFTGYVGNLASLTGDGSVLDKIDQDQAVDEYANITGVPPRIVRSDDAVEEIRAGRAERQAQAEKLAATREAAATAKDLADADVSGDNALNVLLGANAPGRGVA